MDQENRTWTTPTPLGSIILGAGAGTAIGAGLRKLKPHLFRKFAAPKEYAGKLMTPETWNDLLANMLGGTVGASAGYGYGKLQERERRKYLNALGQQEPGA